MWNHKEHVSIVGDTGSGKTYLENRLLRLRDYVVFLRTKAEDPRDDPMDGAWRRVRRAEEINNRYGYWLLEPAYEERAREGARLFARARLEKNWTIAIDELLGATRMGLQPQIEWGLTEGRSQGVTMVCGMQRPAQVSRFALSQSTHVFVFSVEGRDADEILAHSVTPRLKRVLPLLDYEHHQFAYYHRRQRRLLISTANAVERFM